MLGAYSSLTSLLVLKFLYRIWIPRLSQDLQYVEIPLMDCHICRGGFFWHERVVHYGLSHLYCTGTVFLFSNAEVRSSSPFWVEKWLFIGQCDIFKNIEFRWPWVESGTFPKVCVNLPKPLFLRNSKKCVSGWKKMEVKNKTKQKTFYSMSRWGQLCTKSI